MATGCCGCLGLIVLLGAIVAGGFYAMTRGPVEAVHGQLAELKRGDTERAYARLSAAAQARISREEFERLVAGHASLQQHADTQFGFPHGSVQVVNDRAEVKGFLVAPDEAREEASFALVREGGDWKIESIQIGGEAVLDG